MLRAPIAVIPNGADIPNTPRDMNTNRARLKRLLFLGRIHPVKGIDNLLSGQKGILQLVERLLQTMRWLIGDCAGSNTGLIISEKPKNNSCLIRNYLGMPSEA